MKNLIRFWKNDLLNKLIVLSSLALIAAAGVLVYLVFTMPAGKSLQGAVADVIPWISTPARLPPAGTPSAASGSPTISPAFTATSADTRPFASPTLQPTLRATATITPTPLDPMACIPDGPVQKGRVLEIIDGSTARMLIDRLVYVVRYTGVDAPADAPQADKALQKNADLVFAKDVTLFADVSDKDPRGRLLRYVLVGNIFVNLEMIQGGYGAAVSLPPDVSCDEMFKLAQQSAMEAKKGIWAPTPTATPRK
jgi:endonuclease YncB( thermonuclease family)